MIKATVENSAVLAALSGIKDKTANLAPTMDDIGQALTSHIQQALSRGTDPWGQPHKPLSATTVDLRFRGGKRFGKRGGATAKYKRHMGGNHVPLLDTRQHIYNRITHRFDSTSVAVGINDSDNARIGAIQQYGGKAGRGRKVDIPARPYLPIRNGQVDLPKSWEEEVKGIVRRALERAVK